MLRALAYIIWCVLFADVDQTLLVSERSPAGIRIYSIFYNLHYSASTIRELDLSVVVGKRENATHNATSDGIPFVHPCHWSTNPIFPKVKALQIMDVSEVRMNVIVVFERLPEAFFIDLNIIDMFNHMPVNKTTPYDFKALVTPPHPTLQPTDPGDKTRSTISTCGSALRLDSLTIQQFTVLASAYTIAHYFSYS